MRDTVIYSVDLDQTKNVTLNQIYMLINVVVESVTIKHIFLILAMVLGVFR